MKNNLNSLDDVDKEIKKILKEFINQKKNNNYPVNLNIQFNKNKDDINNLEDIDDFIINDNEVYLTMYFPYNLNQLRFEVDERKNLLTIRNFDFSFYKEIWMGFKIKKTSLITSYKNNVLEIKFTLERI